MTEQNKENQRPDAAPASLSVGAVEPKYKKGDHVWAKQPKELAGRTGYVRSVDTYRIYWLKMIIIALAAIYGASHLISFVM